MKILNLSLFLCVASLTASADTVQYFTDRASFEAYARQQQPTENIQTGNIPGMVASSGGGAGDGIDSEGGYIYYTFAKPLYAFGGYFSLPYVKLGIDIYDPITYLFNYGLPLDNKASLTGFTQFVGFVSSVPFSQVDIQQGGVPYNPPPFGHGRQDFTLDNLTVQDSSAAPEPAEYAFLGLGLVGLALARKRLKKV